MTSLKKRFAAGNKFVGEGAECFVIAEAGSNHNRDLHLAKRLVDVACEAGVDAVKFQTFSADTIAAQCDNELTRIDFAGAKSLYELFKGIELPREWQKELLDYATSKGIMFFSTPFDERAVDDLYEIGVDLFKIASFELSHFPLLRYVAQTKKPVLLSTGMSTLSEVEEAVAVLNEEGCEQIGLFHCGIGYPLDPGEVNLSAMDVLKQRFQCPVGYSDHTMGSTIAVAAVARGASIIEKHFTLSRSLSGPDHSFALEPDELCTMVESIRMAEKSIGYNEKVPSRSEISLRKRGFRSIYAKTNIPKGTTITRDMLVVLRPMLGLHTRYLDDIVGKKAKTEIMKYEPISWDNV